MSDDIETLGERLNELENAVGELECGKVTNSGGASFSLRFDPADGRLFLVRGRARYEIKIQEVQNGL